MNRFSESWLMERKLKGAPKKRSKYGANKKVINGHSFDSTGEANRYMELFILERYGNIFNLELQPAFVLQDKFRHNGKSYRAVSYIADFSYRENGRAVIEDFKGVETDIFMIKKKMFLKKYGDDFILRISKKLKGVVSYVDH